MLTCVKGLQGDIRSDRPNEAEGDNRKIHKRGVVSTIWVEGASSHQPHCRDEHQLEAFKYLELRGGGKGRIEVLLSMG